MSHTTTHCLLHSQRSAVHIMVSVDDEAAYAAIGELTEYIGQCSGTEAEIEAYAEGMTLPRQAIVVASSPGQAELFGQWPATIDERTEYVLDISNSEGGALAIICVRDAACLRQAVYRLIRLVKQEGDELWVAENRIVSKPWIRQREWALCPWVPNQVRGEYHNPHAGNDVNILMYSEQRLESYIRMMGSFGFNGVQLMDTCYMWSQFGSVEAFHEKLQQIARIAHRCGQSVTLWVWAACFEGFGWVDREAVYTPKPGMNAFEDPDVRRTFEKYYDKYSDMAPYVDRFVSHFFDPGHLEHPEDTFKYMRLLEQKLYRMNPQVKLGVDVWAGPQGYLQALVEAGFKGYLLLESSFPELWRAEACREFRTEARRLGVKETGIWGWYTADYETDQRPSMYVNGHVVKEVYSNVRQAADPILPNVYWSEMDAYHVVNLFSMFISAQLLCDPEQHPDQLLQQAACLIWGPHNGVKALEALKLIQDVRSGTSWQTYWHTSPQYRLGTPDPAEDRRRAEEALQLMFRLQADERFIPQIPLPVSIDTLQSLIIPHLMQIKQYAEFRVNVDEMKAAEQKGATKDELFNMMAAAWKPIPDLDTWVGDFGQIEETEQHIIVRKLCESWGIPVPVHSLLNTKKKMRIIETMENFQRYHREPSARRFELRFLAAFGYSGFSFAEVAALMEELARDGIVVRHEDDTYSLSNWADYQFMYKKQL